MRIADGKPRPAIIIQSDHVRTPTHVIVCPFTTTLLDAPLYRLAVEPTDQNRLIARSQLMLNRLSAVRLTHVDGVIGALDPIDLERLSMALLLILDLDG